MADDWDFIMKQLLRENPQHFISWVLQDGLFDAPLPLELKRETTYADGLYRVLLYDQPMLVHLEFQSTKDAHMAERLLEYNIQASKQNQYLPVYSCVLYLLPAGTIPESPLIRILPDGREIIRFQYQSIELSKMSADSILQKEQLGLLPLVLFTEDGKRPEVLDEVVGRLEVAQDKEVSALAYALAGLIFQQYAERTAMMRRFAMLKEIIEQSWTYQEIKHRGLEEGRAEGRAEGHQEWLRTQREVLLSAVQQRFPELIDEVTIVADHVEDPRVLQNLMLKMITVQNSQEMRTSLLKVK